MTFVVIIDIPIIIMRAKCITAFNNYVLSLIEE